MLIFGLNTGTLNNKKKTLYALLLHCTKYISHQLIYNTKLLIFYTHCNCMNIERQYTCATDLHLLCFNL